MSEKNKPQGENKPQQPVAPKPTPTQSTTDFATRRVFVGDSADSVIEHIKNSRDKHRRYRSKDGIHPCFIETRADFLIFQQ